MLNGVFCFVFVLTVTTLLVLEEMLSIPSSVRLDRASMSLGPYLLIWNQLLLMKLGPALTANYSTLSSSFLVKKMPLITLQEDIIQVRYVASELH